MKITQYFAMGCSLFFIPFGQAKVGITLPENTEPLLLNGKKIEKQELENSNGIQQLVFKFHDNYRQYGSQKRFSSEAIIVTFSAIDNQYQIKLPNINSAKAAQKFNSTPQVEIVDKQGKSLEYKIDKLIKKGLQLGRDYQQEIQQYNLNEGIAAVEQPFNHTAIPITPVLPVITPNVKQAIEKPTQNATKAEIAPTSDSQINVGQMLDFWYQQADEATKEAFKKRIQAK